MTYLFEDNIKCFPYQLLTRDFKVKIDGSLGNNNLKKYTRNKYPNHTFVFVDVCADNPRTVPIYNLLAKEAAQRTHQYIIPIPSIEYYFIWAFIGFNNNYSRDALSFGDYRKHNIIIDGHKANTRNYENFIKSAIQSMRSCFTDDIFVTKDCLCENSFDNCEQLTLDIKTSRLNFSLPVLLNKMYTNSEILEVIAGQKKLYYEQANRFLELGIITKVLDLKY